MFFVPKTIYRSMVRSFYIFTKFKFAKRNAEKINLTTFMILKGSTFLGCQHSTNVASLRQFDLASGKPLSYLFV
jgi:hypothetical protein